MEYITSKSNPAIKSAAALCDRRERKKTGLFLLEGARLCADAALNGIEIEKLFITESSAEKYKNEFATVLNRAKTAFFISEQAAERLADTKNPQKFFCVCRKKEGKHTIDTLGLYVLLDNVQNPENLGAVVRTAEALGISGLIASSGCDIYSPKAMRASMGALLRFPVITVDDPTEFVEGCKRDGMSVFATVPDSTACDITRLVFNGGAVLIIGNEGNGVCDELLSICTERVTIPMKGKAESLNAAAAAAISMWELLKAAKGKIGI